jgi:hypothetical protein
MVKPDVEMTSAVSGHIFYNGRTYDAAKTVRGWEVKHGTNPIATTASLQKACELLVELKRHPIL